MFLSLSGPNFLILLVNGTNLAFTQDSSFSINMALMFLRYNFWAILWALIILFVCSIPSSEVHAIQPFPNFDKTVHFYMYAQFSFLLMVGFKKQSSIKKLQRFYIPYAFSISALYGVLIEILQFFVFSGRSFELMDILANFLGTIFGIFLFLLIYGKLSK